MKNTYKILFLIIIISFVGCGKDDDNNPAAPTEDKMIVSGKIQNYDGDIGAMVFLKGVNYVYGITYGPVNSDGTFSVELIDPPPTISLKYAYLYFSDGVYLSDPSAYLGCFGLKSFDGKYITGTLYEGNRLRDNSSNLTEPGDFIIYYWYSNKDLEIKGSYVYAGSPGLNINYNINCAKGWNKVVYRLVKTEGSTKFYEYTDVVPEPKAFYYTAY